MTMDVQANPITRAVLDHLPVLEFLRTNGAAHAIAIAQATGRVPSNVRRDLPKLVEGGLLMRTPTEGGEGAVDAYALDASATLALEAMDRARNANLSAGAADGAVSMGVHSEFDRNPDQPRKKFDPAKLEQMADTIEEGGLIKPLLVFPRNEAGVRIIWDGERRWRAAGIVNDRHRDPNRVRIPYVERIPSEVEQGALVAEAAELALVANGQGEDLTSYEKAMALRALVPARYPSARAAAKAIGVHEKTAQDWLRALAELPAGVLKRWEDEELGWREVRDILRPGPKVGADPAQIDIEEVTGTKAASSQQVPLSLRSDAASVAAIEEARLAALVEYFTEEVEEAALAIERAKPGRANFQAANLSGKTTIEGEAWPAEPVEVLKTPWDGYPSAEIRLYASDKGRWAFNLSTAQGGPTYSGSGDAYGVRTCDKLFRSRQDALTFASARIVRQLGEWAKKRKLQDWLASLTAEVHEAQPVEQAPQSSPPLSRAERIALIEATHKALTQNAAEEGRAAQVGAYWLDAGCSRLKDLGLLTFVQAGGEMGWCVMWGEKAPDWFRINMPEVFDADGELAISGGQLALAQAEAATAEWSGPIWSGPGYVTPWLNEFTGASKVTQDGVIRYFAGDAQAEPAADVEAEAAPDAIAEEERAREILGRVADHIVSPANFGELLRATGLVLPLRVALHDVGVINDANGTPVLTVDQDRVLPDALVAARALLIAAAVNAHDLGRELTDRAPASVVEPEKMTPALMRKSIYPDHLVCLEDGRRFTDLTHHVRVEHDMEWGEYLARWKLPRDYPAVAPATSEERERTAIDNARAVLRGTL